MGAYGVGSDTGPDIRGWAPWNKTITRVKKKEVESQVCNKIAWSCQYGFKSMKPYFRPPDIMRTAVFPSLVCATRSVVPDFVIPWTLACQAPLSVRFSSQENWSGASFPSPEDTPNPGIKPGPPTLQADSLLSEPPGKTSLFSVEI